MKKRLIILTFLFFLPLTGLCEEATTNSQEKTEKKEFNPKPASASVYNLGLKSYEQGDTQSAITFFKGAIDMDPQFTDAYYNLGAIYKKQKNYYNAISSFQKVVDLSPEDQEAVFELASCYLEEKNYLKAKQYFSKISTDFPKYTEAKQNIEKANRYLALEGADKTVKEELVKSPEIQAQLLTDTLEKSLNEDIAKEEKAVEKQPENQAQLLVNTLTKPKKEEFANNFKTITSNFTNPAGIVKDSMNNFYIANFTQNRIEKINETGAREVFVENLGIRGPVGLAIDESDNLYVANYNGDSIAKITPNKSVSFIVNKVTRPYYLFYDNRSSKLYATIQGSDSLIEVNTNGISKQPITSSQ